MATSSGIQVEEDTMSEERNCCLNFLEFSKISDFFEK